MLMALENLRKRLPADAPVHWSVFDNVNKPIQKHHWINQADVSGKKWNHPIGQRIKKWINCDWNIDEIPHVGGHIDNYYQFVSDQLDILETIINDHPDKITDLFLEKYLKERIVESIKKAVHDGILNLYTN